MNLTDDKGVKVFKKEGVSKSGKSYAFYSLNVSSKQTDGTWLNAYIPCKFKKGTDVNNKAKIKIKNAFPTLSKYGDKVEITWMIMDFEVVDEGEATAQQSATMNFMDIPDNIVEELPFA